MKCKFPQKLALVWVVKNEVGIVNRMIGIICLVDSSMNNTIKNVENDVDNIVPWTDQSPDRKKVCDNCKLQTCACDITSVWGHNGNETVLCKECFRLYLVWLREYIEKY